MKPLTRIPLVDQVVERLIEYIKENQAEEGSKLPSESALGEMLGVGRGTIREALRILNIKGFIRLIPDRGAFIASKDPSLNRWFRTHEFDLQNIFEVRYALEPLAVSLAKENSSAGDLQRLHQNLEEARRIFAEGEFESLAENDAEFHRIIAEASRNTLLISINKDLESNLAEFRLRTFRFENNRKNYLPAHAAIVEAFDSGSPELCSQRMLDHLYTASADLESSKSDKEGAG